MNRVVPRAELDETVETVAHQIAQAPLWVLMGLSERGKGMGMRVHIQPHL